MDTHLVRSHVTDIYTRTNAESVEVVDRVTSQGRIAGGTLQSLGVAACYTVRAYLFAVARRLPLPPYEICEGRLTGTGCAG